MSMLIYYDLETTGLNQFHDGITEFVLLKKKMVIINILHYLTLGKYL